MIQTDAYTEAQLFLMQIDADWQQLITHVGNCKLASKPEREPYEALVRAVAYQQLSTKAGDAILKKFIQHFGEFPTAQQLLDTRFEALRTIGFSGRKIETIQGIAQARITGLVPDRKTADTMEDEALIERLVTLKGIGQWSVEMMLIFTLQRMDILPVNDFGILDGYRRLKKLETLPSKQALAEISKNWSPYRSIASWYLWQVPK